MRVGTVFCAALAVTISAASMGQAATGYACKIKKDDTPWIPEALFIGHDPVKGEVQISDPIVFYFNDNKPLRKAKIRDRGKKVLFTWTYRTQSVSGQFTTMTYRADVTKATGALYLSAQPQGYPNRFSARGTCDIKEVKVNS